MSFIVKNTTFPGLFDLIAPSSCRGCGLLGEPLCPCCKKYITNQKFNLCPSCKTEQQDHRCPQCASLPPTYILGERSGLLNLIIHDYKYHSDRSLAKPLAEMLSTILPPLESDTILVPLPTSPKHIRMRSLDHTFLIARHLSKITPLKVERLLVRTTNATQVGSDRQTRLTQAEFAYSINPHITIHPHSTYILFDDIWTTGASMQSAIKKLRAAGVSHLIVLLLAVSRLD